MIDIKNLRANPEDYQTSAEQRGIKVDIKAAIKLDADRAQQIAKVEQLRAQLNVKGKPSEDELKALQQAKAELEPLEKQLKQTTEKLDAVLQQIPNLLATDTPEGGEEDNREERTWGKAEKRDGVKDHLTLGEANDWIDFERGAKVAGAKFYFLKGALVRLEMAVVNMAMDLLEKEGFTLMSVPHMANTRTMNGTGFSPRGEERQIYEIEGDDLNLIATAEIPLTGYHADEILEADQLPLLYAGYSPAYRQEAGAYGKHSKGLYRVHQFNKLEMYVFCSPEDSEKWHQKLVEVEERICHELEIPYRLVRIAAGDLGAPAYKKYDIEYWSPVDGSYRELTSCSNVTDYQARRLNIRARKEDGSLEHVHTLNGTAVATSRLLIALLENHQAEDGTVAIPEALQTYYGGKTL
ncbi:serine--tRNA ligase [Patescibacteria group bacterium]|nr:MAG: serine--tRNA ligase [Patescibacteria group bacterium]